MYQANAPELVKKWRSLVNDNVTMARDAALIKRSLSQGITPAQILYGMYQYETERTITIPQFLTQQEDWLVDKDEAEIELACCISHTTPPEYYIWQDYKQEQTSYAYQQAKEAHRKIQQWAYKILS